jgi:hypothetical protein
MDEIKNTSELKEFVKDQNLSDKNSNINFKADIEISTFKNVGQFESMKIFADFLFRLYLLN